MSRISKETFDSTPRALNAVSMRTCYRTHKRQTVVYLQMLKNLHLSSNCRKPNSRNDCGTRQHPFFNDSKQTFFRSTWNHSEKTFVRIPFSTSKHPFSIHGSSFTILHFSKFTHPTSTIASTPPILQLSLLLKHVCILPYRNYTNRQPCEPTPKSARPHISEGTFRTILRITNKTVHIHVAQLKPRPFRLHSEKHNDSPLSH
ncbi:hypothetical protein TNCV_990421 [Trichonephila clavipes]|nr:hypothetical protein TNCV_990421 [Trichonephila clavipes]